MAEKRVIKISAEIEPTLKGMNQIIQKLQEGLSKGSAQINFTKGAGKQVSRLFDTFTEEYKKFQSLTKNGNLDILDSKKALQSGEKIISTFRDLQRIIGDFSSLTVVDAKKLFPEAFDKRVDDARGALNNLIETYKRLDSKGIQLENAKKDLADLTDKATQLKAKLSDTTQLEVDTKTANKALDTANEKVKELQKNLRETYGAQFSEVTKNLEKAKSDLTRREGKINSDRDISVKGKTVRYKGKTREDWENADVSSQQKAEAYRALDNYDKTTTKIKELRKEVKELEVESKTLNNILTNLEQNKLNKVGGDVRSLGGDNNIANANEFTRALEEQITATQEAEKVQAKLKATQSENAPLQKELKETTNKIEQQTQKVNSLKEKYDDLAKGIDFKKLQTALGAIGQEVDEKDVKTAEGLEKIKAILDSLDSNNLEKLKVALNAVGVSAEQTDKFIDTFRNGLNQAGETVHEFTSHQKEVEQFRDRLLQFFSISNSVQLFKRAIRSAFETVKELDGAMTEIAVVSDFSVGDMWEKLPQFTAQANELGVAIKDTYNATALYIQQGLDLQHSMELSNETLKMARIAGMEAANATDAMTSALRGFNMELTETSAKRVNDVYSELAAITASNVEELSTAMSKTASIAHSVNMEFETTAALLAQGIETTRESAETIGTALKTVIGRFSEIKSLYTKGQLTGTDENGEEINVNKVQKALRAAGVDMTKFFTGEEGLDQVFLDLSKKWDSLDITTQRYL